MSTVCSTLKYSLLDARVTSSYGTKAVQSAQSESCVGPACSQVRIKGASNGWSGALVKARLPEAVVGGPAEARPKFWHLADFLCQLTLLNHVFCERPGSLLASSALILSVPRVRVRSKKAAPSFSYAWDDI